MLCASLIALMSWKAGGGTTEIYGFYLGKLPPIRGRIIGPGRTLSSVAADSK